MRELLDVHSLDAAGVYNRETANLFARMVHSIRTEGEKVMAQGDSQSASVHQHGVREAGRAASGAHLAKKSAPSEPKKIKGLSSSYQGRIVALFEDGTSLEIQRGDYPLNNPPKVGEVWPRSNESES